MASGGTSGVISVWNLEKRRLQSVIREAHDGAIISLHFFANEPVLMSSSADNSIKVSQASMLLTTSFRLAMLDLSLVLISFHIIYWPVIYENALHRKLIYV